MDVYFLYKQCSYSFLDQIKEYFAIILVLESIKQIDYLWHR